MSLTSKKFLDSAGTTHLWEKIKTELDKKGQVNSVSAADESVVIGGTATAPTVGVQISSKTGNSLSLETTSGQEGLFVSVPSSVVYSIAKDSTAETGYAATYHLTADGVNTGTAINIPKDMVVSSGEVKTVATANSPYSGAVVGDTYIELTLANATNDKIYIPASSLVEYVTSGSTANDMVQIAIDNSHQVTASIKAGSITSTELDSSINASLSSADSAVQSITTGTNDGTINVDGTEVSIAGLGSAAYTASTAYATAAQGALADSAVQSVVSGTATSGNGTIIVDGSTVNVYGLGSAAFTNSTAYDTAGAATEVYDAIIPLTNAEIDTAISAASSGS